MPAKTMTAAEGEAALRRVLADPPYRHNDDRSTTFLWERPQWVKLHKLIASLPPGLPDALLDEVLGVINCIGGPSDLLEWPRHYDEAVLRRIHARAEQDVDATFVIAALGGRTDGAAMRELLELTRHMTYAARTTREALARFVARPEVLAGAQAAAALELRTGLSVVSHYVPILVADASDESLDILLPRFEEALRDKSSTLDWIRKDLLPLLGDTRAAQKLKAMFDDAHAERTESSPARDWLRALGSDAPKEVKLTLTFRGPGAQVTYMVKVDSTQAGWFCARRNSKWLWRSADPAQLASNVPSESVEYVLRVLSKGIDRRKLDAWAAGVLEAAQARAG